MIRFLFVLLFLYSLNSCFGQKDLTEIFDELEAQSEFSFNYEKDSLRLYQFAEEIPEKIDEKFLKKLLFSTPYEYRITTRNEVLVYKTQPKEYRICGKLVDAESGESLPYSSIKILTSGQGVESDEKGFFSMSHSLLKNDQISISYIGYKTKNLRASEFEMDSCPDVFIESDENILSDDVVIKDYILRDISKSKNYGAFKYDYENFTRKKSSLESDVLKSLQFLPGVSNTDDSATNLIIRGASADHTVVLWENIPLYNPGHMFGMISAINPFVIDQVHLFKDIYHPKYDNRVGSLIDISLNDKPINKSRIGAGFTLTEGHFFLESPVLKDQLSIIFAGRKSLYDLFQSQTFASYSETIFQNTKIQEQQTEIIEGDRSAENDLEFQDINIKVNFKPIETVNISASYFNSKNQFKYFSEEFYDDLSSLDNVEYKVEAYNGNAQIKWTDQNISNVEYSKSITKNNLEFAINNFEEEELLVSSVGANSINDETFKIEHIYYLLPDINIGMGYVYNEKGVGFLLSETNAFEDDFFEEEKNSNRFHNFYGNVTGSLNKWNFNSSIKMIRPFGADRAYFSPRIHLQLQFSKALSINITSGRTFQFINQLEEFGGFELNLSGNIWILKDTEDDAVEANKISIGTLYKKNGWLVDISGYRNEINGLSLLQASSSGVDAEHFQNGQSTSTGIDILLNKNWNILANRINVQSWITYSWNQNDYFFPDISSLSFPATIQQEHIFKFVNKINYKKFQLMGSYQFKSGLPYSQALGIKSSDNEDEYIIDYESINGQLLSHYHRFDIGATYLHNSKNINFEVSMSVLNVLDHINVLSRTSYVHENEMEEPFIFSSEKRLLRRTPLLMMRLYW